MLFPYEEIRGVQEDLIQEVEKALNEKTNLIVHAPTGLGKTVSALAPALEKAREKNLTILFLTSRHTQHKIAVETLRAIKEKFNIPIPIVDIIGKKHMCLQENVQIFSSGEFAHFCKKMVEDNKCEYYENMKRSGKISVAAQKVMDDITQLSPMDVEHIVKHCHDEKVCPYEISLLLAKEAKVIIADYYYVFNQSIQKNFFNKTELDLENCIIIVDEAHNLPARIRNLLSKTISTFTLNQARKEAQDLEDDISLEYLDQIQDVLLDIIGMDEEKTVQEGQFIISNRDEMIEHFEFLAEQMLERNKHSYFETIAEFLKFYSDEEGYANIIRHVKSQKGERIELVHSCLDPSIISKPIFHQSYSTILMSGTLTPIQMFRDVLGMEGNTKELPSPFPKKNKLNLIVPNVTTKYSERSEEQYKLIADSLIKICNQVPGNILVFFPSYFLRDQVQQFFDECNKTVFMETPGLSKEEKADLLERFKSYKESGAVLLGVASGSFGEGVDLPGDLLKCVVIVGLPLNKPDLETQALMKYYDMKYQKGWDYGYILPAIATVMQNAGRCIRSETDKGVIVYMDKRYAWQNYRKCFSEDIEVTLDFDKITSFFLES